MITIIDYGLGNISAFLRVYEQLNIPVSIANCPVDLRKAKKIIFPGVGAHDNAIERLNNSGMRLALECAVIKNQVPIIGVCVGMQMMARSSEEGSLEGLGWIDGTVKKLDYKCREPEKNLPLPHMGWNSIEPLGNSPLFQDLYDYSRFYFLHSYYLECNDQNDVIASTEYVGQFPSAIRKDNIFGVQFHPEKSHEWGILLLSNFAKC